MDDAGWVDALGAAVLAVQLLLLVVGFGVSMFRAAYQ